LIVRIFSSSQDPVFAVHKFLEVFVAAGFSFCHQGANSWSHGGAVSDNLLSMDAFMLP